jgi:hypothetical protein
MDLKQFRKQYPAYNDWSDQELATGLHKQYYSDMPFEKFAGQIGYTPSAEEETPASVTPVSTLPVERPQTEAKTSNIFKGIAARGAKVLGEGVEGFTRATEAIGKKMEGSLTEEERAGMQALKEKSSVPTIEFDPNTYKNLQGTAINLRNWAADIGYSPTTQMGEIPGNPLKVVPFIVERVLTSTPDMVAAVALAPAYVTARTNEILNERIKNDGKTLNEVTVRDVAIAASAAAAETYLEKAATTRLFRPTAAKTGAGRIGKETAIQSGTEGIEEGIGYLGGTAGTKKGVDYRELGEQVLEGMIVGGGLGAGVQGTKEAFRPKTPPTDTTTGEPKFEVDPQTGVLRPVQTEATTETTAAAPLTTQGELFTKEEAPFQVTPGDVSVEAQARQEQSDRAQEQIVVLNQQLAQTTDPQQAAAIRDDISKLEPLVQQTGQQKAISLGNEIVTLQRKREALTGQVAALEAERDAEKTLDGKKLITEQIKAIENQVEQIATRQEAVLVEGKQLEKEGVTFDKPKDEIDLKGPSPIVGNVMSKFGLPPRVPVRQRIKNLDMTDPVERAQFEQEIFEFDAKSPGKVNLEAVQAYIDAFTPVQQEALNEPGTVSDVGARAGEPSVSMPSGQPTTTAGTTTPTATGLAGAVPTTGGPVAGTGAVDQTGPGALTTPKIEGDLKGKATINLADRITQGDLKGALQEIATSDQYSPLDKLVAKRLLQAKTLPKVEIVSPEVTGGYPAQYDPNIDTIQITAGNIDSHTVLHEAVHGFLHVMIKQSEAREARGLGGNARLNSLKDVYNHVKAKRPDLIDKYGMKDLSEFASEAMSNPDFQNDLRNTPYRRSNVFTEFGRAVLRAMGIGPDKSGIADIDSLAGALMAAEGALSTGRKMQEDVQGGVRQEVEPEIAKALGNDYEFSGPDTVGMTEKRIKDLFSDSAYTMDDAKAKGFIGYVNPQRFLDATRTYDETDRQESKENKPLDAKALAEESQHIFLTVEKADTFDDAFRITGHEGRHRMMALRDAGVTQVPVYFRFYQGEKRSIEKSIYMIPQRFGSESAIKGFTVNELVPINYDNYKFIKEKFGAKQGQIAYMQRTPEAEKAEKDSAAFAASAGPVPKAGFFKRTLNKLQAVRNGNLNVGSAVFGNLQNFAANNQAFLNLMRKETLELEKKGSITHAQAEATMLGLIGAQITQRAQLAVQMMDRGNWKYDPITNTYDPTTDKDNMAVFGDLANSLAKRLGVSPEVALSYIDQALEANRLQSVDDKLIKAKGELTRAESRVAFLENDVKRQKTPAGTRTASEQRAFDRAENARIETVRKELNLKKELVKDLTERIELYTDQMMHKDRANIKAGMALYNDHPEIQEATRVFNVMRERTVDLMVETGLLTKEKAETWLDEAAYVPFFRDVESAAEEAQQVITKGLRETMAPLRAKYKGSMEEVTSVTSNMRQWMQWALAGSISNRQIKRMLDQYKAYLPDEVREGRDPNKGNFTVMEDGVERVYNVDSPEIAQAFIQQGAYIYPLMNIAKGVSDIARKNITRIPLFSVGQIPADLYAAMFTSGIRNPGALVVRLLSEAVKTTAGMSQTRKDLVRRGLLSTHEYNAQLDEDSIKYAQDIVPPSAYRRVMHLLDRFGAVSENVIRQAVYNQLRSEGATPQKAETAVVEVINFRNKSGIKAVNSLSSSVIFFNSYLQSAALILKTLSGKGITYQTRAQGLATLGIVSAKIATFSFLLAALSDMADEEDEYAKRSRAAKNRIFNIPGTDGMGLAVREDVYVLPHILAQYAYRNMFREIENRGVDMKSFKGSLKNVALNSLVPPSEGVPQLFKPTIEGALGVNIHTGRDIVPEHMKALEPELQFNATTAEYAKAIGAATGTSPLMIEHFVKGYFGTTAQLFDMLFGGLIADARDIPRPARSTKEVLAKLPSVGASFSKEENMAVSEDLYEAKKEFDRALKTYKKLNETDSKAAEAYRKENQDLMHNPAGTVKELENIKRRENYVRNLPSREKNPEKGMSAEEKAAELDILKERKNRLEPLVQGLRRKADF